jgi:Tol biopolymer transport system component/DNA-binding winged helix-turn-helix (wHTH) protein
MDAPNNRGQRLRFGVFEADLLAHELYKRGTLVRVQDKPFQMLTALLEHPGEVVTREELRRRLWPDGTFVDFEKGLNTAVKKLRSVLSDSAGSPRFIETIPRKGYRFIAPVVSDYEGNGDGNVLRPSKASDSLNPTSLDHHKIQSKSRTSLGWRLQFIVVAGLAVLTTLVVGSWITRPNGSVSELRQYRLTSNSSEDPVRSGAISPDGKYLAYADLKGIHIKLLKTGETRLLAGAEGRNGQRIDWMVTSWFPDSTRFLANIAPPTDIPALVEEHSAWELSVVGGPPRKLRDHAFATDVSPDGSLVVFTDRALYAHEAWLMDVHLGRAWKLYQADEGSWFAQFQWSPDGRRLLFFHSDSAGESIQIRDLKGGPSVTVFSGPGIMDYLWLRNGRLLYALKDPGTDGTSCNYWEMLLGNATQRAEHKLRRLTNWAGFCMDRTLASSDGKRLTFLKSTDQSFVYVADVLDRGRRITAPVRLTSSEGRARPEYWTPDSRTVVFSSNHEGSWGIYKQTLGEDRVDRVVSGLHRLLPGSALTPDGKWLLYQESVNGSFDPTAVNVLRVAPSGGPSELVVKGQIRGVHCARAPVTLCVFAELNSDASQLIFSALDPTGGLDGRLLQVPIWGPVISAWDWALSPDGNSIAYIDRKESRIRMFNLKSKAAREIYVYVGNGLAGLSWAADGNGFFVSSATSQGSSLLYMDLKGNTRTLWEQKGSVQTSAVPSPDGRHVAVLSWNLDNNIWMMEKF